MVYFSIARTIKKAHSNKIGIDKEVPMIARLWHGITTSAKADEYVDYLNKTGIPDYQATEGNLGVQLLRRIEGEQAHFLIITFWESVDAVKKFAGEDYEKARYYAEDQNFLLEFEEKVIHYEVTSSTMDLR
jgi:heme-degrading monooxygenase HmoA